jgi:hypothetical protein
MSSGELSTSYTSTREEAREEYKGGGSGSIKEDVAKYQGRCWKGCNIHK